MNAGIPWEYNSSTTIENPGTEKFRMNNAAKASVTQMAIRENFIKGGGDASEFVESWDDSTSTVKGVLVMRKKGAPTNFAVYQISSLTDEGEWAKVNVTHVASGGAWSSGDVVQFDFYRTGDAGKEGAAGSASMNGFKEPCRAATTANITISTALNNADVLDGVTLATGDRVLVKNQTTAKENGIYVVGVTPIRSTDADTSAEITSGLRVAVSEGTVNKDTDWQLTTNAPITLGTTELTFARRSGAFAEVKVETGVTTAITSVDADIPGLTVTVPDTGRYRVTTVLDTEVSVLGGGAIIATCLVNAVGQSGNAIFTAPTAGTRDMLTRSWIVEATAGQIIKMQIRKSVNAGTAVTSATHSEIIVEQII